MTITEAAIIVGCWFSALVLVTERAVNIIRAAIHQEAEETRRLIKVIDWVNHPVGRDKEVKDG